MDVEQIKKMMENKDHCFICIGVTDKGTSIFYEGKGRINLHKVLIAELEKIKLRLLNELIEEEKKHGS